MHHKRRKHKNQRAGCLMCKRNKIGGGQEHKLGHAGFGKLRNEAAAKQELKENNQ